MTAFRKQPMMFYAPMNAPLNAHAWTDNTMPKRDWIEFDIPTKERKPARKYERKQRQAVSALVRRQAQ